MKISYYQWLLLEAEDKKQAGRDAVWAEHGPAIVKRINSGSQVFNSFFQPEEKVKIMNSYRKYMNPYAKDSGLSRKAAHDADILFAKTKIPDHILRTHIEKLVQEAVPHPKYEKAAMRWLANGSVNRTEDLSMVGERMKQHMMLTNAGRLKDQISFSFRSKKDVTTASTDEWGNNGRLPHPDRLWLDPTHHVSQVHAATRARAAELQQRRAAGTITPDEEDALQGHEATIAKIESKKLIHSDVNSFPNWDTFAKVVAKHADLAGRDLLPKPVEGVDYHIVHDDDDVTVFHPKNHATARYLTYSPDGKGRARWCTGYDSPLNYNNYSSSGALLIYHPKKPIREGEMYQTHPNEASAEDNRLSPFLMSGSNFNPAFGHVDQGDGTYRDRHGFHFNKVTSVQRFPGFGERERRAYEARWKAMKGKL